MGGGPGVRLFVSGAFAGGVGVTSAGMFMFGMSRMPVNARVFLWLFGCRGRGRCGGLVAVPDSNHQSPHPLGDYPTPLGRAGETEPGRGDCISAGFGISQKSRVGL